MTVAGGLGARRAWGRAGWAAAGRWSAKAGVTRRRGRRRRSHEGTLTALAGRGAARIWARAPNPRRARRDTRARANSQLSPAVTASSNKRAGLKFERNSAPRAPNTGNTFQIQPTTGTRTSTHPAAKTCPPPPSAFYPRPVNSTALCGSEHKQSAFVLYHPSAMAHLKLICETKQNGSA
ncbi:hypothetical protein FGB62_117g038 [Gracilaria domingensis]|nr:hypothetical protein FGB62_117g038 [Gracilaria domingensis]